MKKDIEIIFENEDIVAINKPAGLVVHYDGKTKEPSVVDWVKENYPQTQGVGEPTKLSSGETIDRPGIVHRLDRETSGVLLIAKNQEAYEHLKKQFQKSSVRKIYKAFVYGKIKQSRGKISRPIGRSKNDFRKHSASKQLRGKEREATTIYNVVKSTDEVTYITAYPQTGRTHQIRVHMLSIHHPVLCDSLYVPFKEHLLGFDRLALHAYSIEFRDTKGGTVEITAPLPDDFIEAEKKIGI